MNTFPKYDLNGFYYMVLDTDNNRLLYQLGTSRSPRKLKTRCSTYGPTKGIGFNNQKRYTLQKFVLAPVPWTFKF